MEGSPCETSVIVIEDSVTSLASVMLEGSRTTAGSKQKSTDSFVSRRQIS